MATGSQEITFVVPGQALPSGQASTALNGTVKGAVRVGARRGGGEAVRVTARPGEDVVLLHIANGPTLYLHPEDARELLRAQAGAVQGAERGVATLPPADGEVRVPAQLGWRGLGPATAARGGAIDWIGDVVLDLVEVVTGLFKDKAVDLVTAQVTKKVDGQVDPGVYRLSPNELASLKGSGRKAGKVPAAPAGEATLVLMHGTFVDTASTFGTLWKLHPARVRALFKRYGDRVYALDHPTLGVSPFGNALTLLDALPDSARLHLVTHSRGGIVAELLARICGGRGLTRDDLALFEGAGYARHRKELAALAKHAKRGIAVERIVRVACPARGTLLASRRLDAYLSVLKWGLELAGAPVVPALVDFLSEVARRRARPEELPGLEAMMPGRPMAKWLNAPAEPVPGELRVVAGDVEGDSVLSWVKTLLSDSFYWTDNDLVVQTRSMYGGTPRAAGAASFVLDRGGKVTHFNYFANERTAAVITDGLTLDQPGGFRPIGPMSWAGEDASGIRAARAAASLRSGSQAERPAVFVLPGILGSHLTVDGKRVWLSLRFVNNLDRLKWDPATARQVKPDGPVGFSYDDLIDHLGATHEVVPFGFDWRRPIEDEAKRLAELVDIALKVRQATQQPVRLIAHSMGGLVARTMQLERPETWKRMMARDGARLLMLGTPNGGSFAPMQVLSGDDRFGNLLSAFGSLFDDHGARQLIAGMPGLLQLQAALIDGAHGLGKTAGWRALAEADLAALRRRRDERSWWHSDALQIRSFEWGVPPQPVLDKAVALRRALDAQREALGADAAKILLVVGKAPLTPVDVRATDDGVEYLDVPEDGDGRVTFASASLPGVRAWQVDAVHGDLADHKPAFGAYVELLSRGATSLLPAAVPVGATRGGAPEARALVRSRPARVPSDGHPPVAQRDVIAPLERRVERRGARGSRLRVRFVHGNLKFVREPLMLGHYRSLKLSGTEAVIDTLLDGVMSEALRAGLYPSVIASSQIFRNTRRNPEDPFVLPRPEAAIVVGLGEEGLLRMSGLAETVRQGVLAYAKRVGERGGGGPTTFELAATLIGSGGYSVSVGTAAQAVVIGVSQANQRLAEVGWPQVAVLHLIEVFLDRATEGHNALRTLSEEAQDFVVEDAITRGRGGLPRPIDAGYRGADYDFISVQRRGEGDDAPIEFTLDTRRARDEVRGVPVQPQLVDELVQAGANAANNDRQIGRTLFQLLVPLEIEPFLSGSSSVLLQLDRRSARYPWELLDTPRNDRHGEGDARPWAVRTRLVRKLRTPDYRERPRDANSDADILIIGEPLCDAEKYPPLPGAAAEARVVAEALGVRPLLNEGARTIMNAVYDKAYKIVHVAGHGDVIGGIGGVVLSDGTLGPREIKAMRTVPELAFINCCHLGRFDVAPVEGLNPVTRHMPAFAANVAEELIKIGVRCVVAAGWAVDDEPAMAFARCFYAKLLLGCPFVEAVGIARQETWADYRNSNTWAAYQCYGDPDWTYVPGGGDARAPRRPPVTSAEALVLRLRSLVVAHSYDGRPTDDVRSEIDELARACAGRWGGEGAVATAFGAAFAEIEDFDRAVEWYERALRTEDGGGTLHATEQLGNVRARRGEKMGDLAAGRQEIDAGITLLLQVAEFGLTVERASLLGSAYKRMAMLEQRAKRRAAAEDALKAAAEWYGKAEDIARRGKADNLYYPAMNRMSIALMLDSGRAGPGGFGASEVAAVRASLEKKNADDPDFWSVIGLTELRIYEALGKRQLARAVEGIVGDLKDLKARAASRRGWSSVADQARLTLTPYAAATDLPPGEREAAARLLAEFGAGGEKETGKRAEPRKRREKSGRKRRK